MKKIILILFFAFTFSTILFAGEKVLNVNADGVIELEGGSMVMLAGIQWPEESIVLMQVLLHGKECEIKEAKEMEGKHVAENAIRVYMYLETADLLMHKELPNKSAREKRMVNEFLLSIGSATVDSRVPFKFQDQFIAIEERAREEGQGVWSYELPSNKTLPK